MSKQPEIEAYEWMQGQVRSIMNGTELDELPENRETVQAIAVLATAEFTVVQLESGTTSKEIVGYLSEAIKTVKETEGSN